jgi:hypothetical protein
MVATRASVARIEENPDFEAGVSDAEAPEYYPEFAAFGGRPPTRCPGHLTELEPDREIIRLAANDGREMVSLEEYEYLTEYEIPSGISLEDVETQVFPLPEVGGDKADLLKEFSDERSRTLVSVPAGFLDVLRAAKVRDDLRAEGEVADALVAEALVIGPPRYTWVQADANFTNASRTWKDVYYHVEHTIEGSVESCVSWFKNPISDASSHVVSSFNGHTHFVMVSDEDIAWTAGNWEFNQKSLQRENEGFASRGGWPERFYASGGHWVAHHFTKFRIPFQYGFRAVGRKGSAYRAGLIGHFHVPYPSTHVDPGPHFDYEKLMYYARKKAGKRPYHLEPPR